MALVIRTVLFLLCLIPCFALRTFGQPGDTSAVAKGNSRPFSLALGAGTGALHFFGDVGSTGKANPLLGRFGFDISIASPISNHFDLGLHFLKGELGMNERSLNRNLNFETNIICAGLGLLYNFGHFYKKKHVVNPFISLGLNFLEFNPKADLKDANGSEYYYTNDGNIVFSATYDSVLNRDYVYETDLRKSNFDSIGNYPHIAFSIPLGIGVQMHISERLRLKIGTTLYYTFTDLLDNVSSNGTGVRKGNPANDIFLYSGVSFHYDLIVEKPREEEYQPDEIFLAMERADEDGDGVRDFNDKCPGTPKNVAVDTLGCPPDGDRDGVPDYADEQLNTPYGVFVDAKGVQIPDSVIELAYLRYIDSLPALVRRVRDKQGRPLAVVPQEVEIYKVQVGKFPKGINPSSDFIDKSLSIQGIESELLGDGSTIFTVGSFQTPEEAELKRQELLQAGIPDLALVLWMPGPTSSPFGGQRGASTTFVAADKKVVEEVMKENPRPYGFNPFTDSEKILYRVQLGAFKGAVSKNIFAGVKDVIIIPGKDGISKYVTGEFTDLMSAAKHKTLMMVKGFEDAFITAYRGGKQISISEAGGTPPVAALRVSPLEGKEGGLSEIVYKVKIGLFTKDVPVALLEKFIQIGDVQQQSTPKGTLFTSGTFSDKTSADTHLQMLIQGYGLSNASIVAFEGEKEIEPLNR